MTEKEVSRLKETEQHIDAIGIKTVAIRGHASIGNNYIQ